MRWWLLVLFACGKSPVTPDAPSGLCSDTRPLAPTFANVQQLFSTICTTCHTDMVELDLRAGASYGNLVGKPALDYAMPPTTDSCGGTLVDPGHPETSYLYIKVSSDAPCAGSRMPLTDIGTPSPLVPCEQAVIHDWIAAGAPNN
jgi:hypothetical protein